MADHNAQPPATEAADENAGNCEIIDGIEQDNGVATGNGDKTDAAASAVQTSQAAFVVPGGFKRLGEVQAESLEDVQVRVYVWRR